MTWDNAIENYKTYLILERSLSANSVEAYIADIQKLARFCDEKFSVGQPAETTYEMLKDFLVYINEIGITSRTQARSISSIRSFFKFLVFDGVIQHNPTKLLEAPKVGRKLPNILTTEEIDAMLNAVEMYKPEGQRNKAIIETLYSCGLRVSELINVKLSNINFRLGIIKIEGKGNKERIIPLSRNARQEIKQYLKVYRDYLDIEKNYEDYLYLNKRGTSLSRVMVFNIIKHLAERAGIKKSVSPHTFRHSFASHLVNGGADLRAVQDMLGHESILTTEIYTHLDDHYLKDTINKFHPRALKESQQDEDEKQDQKNKNKRER